MAKQDTSNWTDAYVEVGAEDETQILDSGEGVNSWKNSGLFLGRLACLTEEGEVPEFQGHKCKYLLSKEYTITGYEGGPEGQGIVQVNGRDLLSLEAEAIGTVLDINFSGQWPLKSLPTPDAILELLEPDSSAHNLKWMGYRIDSFLPGLKEYLQYKKDQLLLPGRDGYIAGGLAYCLNQELLNKAEYNWADFKSENLKSALNCKSRGGKDHLTYQIRSFLDKYVSAAVPVLRQALRPGGVLGGAAARRSSMRRNSASAKQSNQQASTKWKTPSRKSSRNKEKLKCCSTREQAEAGKSGQNCGPRKKQKGKDNMEYGAAEAQHRRDMENVIMKLRNAEQENKETSQKCVEGLSAGIMEMAESSAWLRLLFSSKYNKLKADNKALRAELRRLRDNGGHDL